MAMRSYGHICVGIAALVFATVAGWTACGAPSHVQNATIRVGSYNIRYVAGDRGTENDWQKRRADLVAQVRSLNFDAFGLQEVDPEQMHDLRTDLPEFAFVGEHRNPDRKSGEASPVAYRKDRFDLVEAKTFWLSETPDVPGSMTKSWDAACRRVCTYAILSDRRTGKRLCYVNAHVDFRSPANEKGMRLILDRMKDFAAGIPVVFTGDHNCVETDKSSEMASGVLKNALYASESPPEGPWLTLCLFPRRDSLIPCVEAIKTPISERVSKEGCNKFGVRIDYIYVSPSVRVLNYRTDSTLRHGLDLYPSDHFPVVATLLLQ